MVIGQEMDDAELSVFGVVFFTNLLTTRFPTAGDSATHVSANWQPSGLDY